MLQPPQMSHEVELCCLTSRASQRRESVSLRAGRQRPGVAALVVGA